MSRVCNADEFLRCLREIDQNYNKFFGPRVQEIREQYTDAQRTPPLVDEALEAHIRAYVVNETLSALNWRINLEPHENLPDLVPESPVTSVDKGTTRFIDYLGFEAKDGKPVFVVETKRPSSKLPLPELILTDQATEKESVGGRRIQYARTIHNGLRGKELSGGWSKWLSDLSDYVRSVKEKTDVAPKRAILTNGDWLIIFLNPQGSFINQDQGEEEEILVYEDRNDIIEHFADIYNYLEYEHVIGKKPGLRLGELRFYITARDVRKTMHGLRLLYQEQLGLYKHSPVIKVAPILYIQTRFQNWFYVEAKEIDFDLPHEADGLAGHLQEVQDASEDLLQNVNDKLEASFRPIPLAIHYENEDTFATLQGVEEDRQDEYRVLTGDKTHYLKSASSPAKTCIYHNWSLCNEEGVAADTNPVMKRSIDPRSFFISKENNHCAHCDVTQAKETPITKDNRERCGSRSGKDGQAFCEIWSFEEHLCCRTCAFEEVCTKAEVFQLPCAEG